MNSLSHKQSNRRLALSLLLSTVIIFTSLSLIDLEIAFRLEREIDPVLELKFTEPAAEKPLFEMPAEAIEPTVDAEPIAEHTETNSPEVDRPDETIADAFATARRATDWYAELQRVARDESINGKPKEHMGDFDERLRVAALSYYPSPDNGPKPIWENTEIDQLGRTLLWHGDCYRVLNDPNVMNLYVYETFTQYLVFCQTPYDVARELPWVQEVVARYDYLQGDDSVYVN